MNNENTDKDQARAWQIARKIMVERHDLLLALAHGQDGMSYADALAAGKRWEAENKRRNTVENQPERS